MDELEASYLPHQRQARKTGRPALGAGAVYQVDIDQLLVDPVPIPPWWPQAYALDVGWQVTAALFGAHDRDHDIYYLTGEYYGRQKEPVIHAHALKSMMRYPLLGAIDPAAEGSNQKDGSKLKQEYEDLGLDLSNANNAVEAGIHRVTVLMQSGRLRVFSTLSQWQTEIAFYQRDEKGKIKKDLDHVMDCMRYLLFTDGIWTTKPLPRGGKPIKGGEW